MRMALLNIGLATLQLFAIACHADNLPELLVPSLRTLSIQCGEDIDSLARQSHRLVQQNLKGLSQGQVAGLFLRQHIPLVAVTDTEQGRTYKYLVQGNAVRSSGLSFALYVLTQSKRPSTLDSCWDAIVEDATSELHAVVNKPVSAVLQAGALSRDSSIGRVIRHDDVSRRAEPSCVLATLAVSYKQYRHHREAIWPFGYSVRVRFIMREGVDAHFLKMWGWVLSRQDRATNVEGEPVDEWPYWIPLVQITGWETSASGILPSPSAHEIDRRQENGDDE